MNVYVPVPKHVSLNYFGRCAHRWKWANDIWTAPEEIVESEAIYKPSN